MLDFIHQTKAETLAVIYDVKPNFDFSNIDFTLECQTTTRGSFFMLKTRIPETTIEVNFKGSHDEVVIKTKVLLQWANSDEGQLIIQERVKQAQAIRFL